jgi:complex iron-sulfur molybdoenzyme family reductase subunit gamma
MTARFAAHLALLVLSGTGSPVSAAPPAKGGLGPLAPEVLEASEVPAPLPTDPGSPLWDTLPQKALVAAPQSTVRLHDRKANEALAKAANRALRVRAATDGASVAVVVEWSDASENRSAPDGVDVFGDAAAIQFPLRYGAGTRLPYVGMGDDAERVAIFLERAGANGTTFREAIGAGFGTLARADLGGVAGGLRRDPSGKGWRALFVRPLSKGGVELGRGLVPFAVAIWDGGASERAGNKALTGWKYVRLARFALDPAYVAELSWGFAPGDLGDARKGKELFEGMCAACHVAGPGSIAPAGIAPDLGRIGVIATPSYLRESIVAPSAVVVPSPNPAQHQDRAAKAAAGAAWPLDEAYVWFRTESDGKRTSTMPDFSGLSKEEVAALVAHLRTLGVDAAHAGGEP